MTLPASATVFSIEMATLQFGDPSSVRVAHRLDGFDHDWIETEAGRRVATYTRLAPGSYVLRARARAKNGVWSPAEARLAMEGGEEPVQVAMAGEEPAAPTAEPVTPADEPVTPADEPVDEPVDEAPEIVIEDAGPREEAPAEGAAGGAPVYVPDAGGGQAPEVIIEDAPLARLLAASPRLFLGGIEKVRGYTRLSATRAIVTSDEAIAVHRDGDPESETRRIEVALQPRALTVVTPAATTIDSAGPFGALPPVAG